MNKILVGQFQFPKNFPIYTKGIFFENQESHNLCEADHFTMMKNEINRNTN